LKAATKIRSNQFYSAYENGTINQKNKNCNESVNDYKKGNGSLNQGKKYENL
jgi:predicted ester cyclase